MGNDSLTGDDVNEASLGEVPNATNADSATTAGTAENANNLGGQPEGDFIRDFRQVSATSANNSTSPKSIKASCSIGEIAIGGGASISGGVAENVVLRQGQVGQQFSVLGIPIPAGFTATGVEANAEAGNWSVTARAICASRG